MITRDPLGEAGRMNLYRVVGNNPISFVDPDGELYLEILTATVVVGLTAWALHRMFNNSVCDNVKKKRDELEKAAKNGNDVIKPTEDYLEALIPFLDQTKQATEVLEETTPWELAGPSPKRK